MEIAWLKWLPCMQEVKLHSTRGSWDFFSFSEWQNKDSKEVVGETPGYACKYAPMRIWNNKPYTHRCVYGIKWVKMATITSLSFIKYLLNFDYKLIPKVTIDATIRQEVVNVP